MNHDGTNETGPLSDVGEHRVRLTQDNLRAMLSETTIGTSGVATTSMR